MRETTRRLFIVAPDANAATLKKLRGIGIATGTSITAVQSVSDLAMPPPACSTLLIPDYLIDQGYQINDWHSVFEISQNLQTINPRDRNVISSKESPSAGTDWIQIVNQFIRHFFDGTSSCRWYSIQKSFLFKAHQLTPQLTNWMASHQIKMTSKLSVMIKSLEALDKMASSGPMQQQERALDVMLDTKYLEIKFKIPGLNLIQTDSLQNTFSAVEATLLTFTKTRDAMVVKIQLPLTISNENSFVVFMTNQHSDSVDAQPEKEAS